VNPLDLRGPQFLGFYVVFAVVVLVVARFARRLLETAGAPPRVSDPHALAMIRAGREEAVRTALLALSERGAVTIYSVTVETQANARGAGGLETAVLRRCESKSTIARVAADPEVARELDDIEARLEAQGLLADFGLRRRRGLLFLLVEALLIGVAVAKIQIALARGRTNIEFLVILCIAAAVAAWAVVMRGDGTSRGASLLAELRTLLAPMGPRAKRRASRKSPDWPNDVAMLAAVFGPTEVPATIAAKSALWPAPARTTSGDFGASSGVFVSSCGSHSSHSCGGGSSCGGGGGGGGCGGCGSS